MNGSSLNDMPDPAGPEQERIERLYGEARDLETEARVTHVRAALRQDPALAAEVLSLLEHADAAEAFFGRLQEQVFSDPPWAEFGGAADALEASAPPDPAPGTMVGRYRIVARIGAGGMGTVYRAHDPALDRDVALKLLPAHLATDPAARERLRLEARAAAALDHPNICTVHEVGEAEDGRLFLAMARYEGETLKERLARGSPPVDEAVAYAVQLARALAAAHARGIVHRDVKPGNALILADGTVKLLDFGLARVAGATPTRPGLTPGTVAYMSPEQVQGERVDRRTDLWSLGVVLYEMLAGSRPFRGDGDRVVLDAIVNETPRPIRSLRPDTPEPLARAVERLLEKRPAARYDGAEEVLADLDPGAATLRPRRRAALPRRAVPALLVGLAALAIAAGAAWLMRSRSAGLDPQRVVVAPFENRTGDAALDPIGSMAAYWITEGISRAEGVAVVPTASALVSARRVQAGIDAGAGIDPSLALAQETGAGLVVSGAFYLSGDSLRFRTQITDARRRLLLHALEPVVGAAADPAAAIGVLGPRALAALAPYVDPRFAATAERYGQPPSYDAYREYADGMELFLRGRFRESIPLFERALAFDSTYLAPWWLMQSAYLNLGDTARSESILSMLERSRERLTPFQRAGVDLNRAFHRSDIAAAYEAARRAAEIAPQSLPHVQVALEAIALNRPREAIRVLSEIDPTRGVVHEWGSYWLAAAEARHVLGHHRRELRQARRGRALHPDGPLHVALEARALAALGRVGELEPVLEAGMVLGGESYPLGAMLHRIGDELRIHGRPEDAIDWYDRAIGWFAGRPPAERARGRLAVGEMLFASGRLHEAHARLSDLAADSPEDVRVQGLLGAIAARLGDRAEAERISTTLAAIEDPPPGGGHTFQRACIAAQLGRPAEAVTLLREAFARGFRHGWGPRHAACLDPLRDYAPFRELMRPTG